MTSRLTALVEADAKHLIWAERPVGVWTCAGCGFVVIGGAVADRNFARSAHRARAVHDAGRFHGANQPASEEGP